MYGMCDHKKNRMMMLVLIAKRCRQQGEDLGENGLGAVQGCGWGLLCRKKEVVKGQRV